MPRYCAKCKAAAHNEYRVVGSEAWVYACSETCARELIAPAATAHERIGRALDAALIGPEQEDAAAIPDATLEDVPDELVVEILKNYPPSKLLRLAGTNARMRAIVLDPRTIQTLVDYSLARNATYEGGRRPINEWIALATHAAGVGQVALVEAIVAALDAQPSASFMGDNLRDESDIPKPIFSTVPGFGGFAFGNPNPPKALLGENSRAWRLTRFIMAVRTGDVVFARTAVRRVTDISDVVGLAAYVVRMRNVASMRAYLACYSPAPVRFTFDTSLTRKDLFHDKRVFAELLASPHWNITNERSSEKPSMAPGDDCVITDAILLRDHEIVAMILASGRMVPKPKLLDLDTSDQVIAVLLANRVLNPFGYQTLASYRRMDSVVQNLWPSQILPNRDFLLN